jgi:hypothetical protein
MVLATGEKSMKLLTDKTQLDTAELRIEKEHALHDLKILAGSTERLASLLGVDKGTVYAWTSKREISTAGALLVEFSKELGKYFDFYTMRPDLTDEHRAYCMPKIKFQRARVHQIAFEKDQGYKLESPTAIARRRRKQLAARKATKK